MYTLNNNLWGVTKNYNGNPGQGAQCSVSRMSEFGDYMQIAIEIGLKGHIRLII